MLNLYSKKKLRKLKDIISGISIKLYWLQLKILWMLWNTEFAVRAVEMIRLHQKLSLKFIFNSIHKKLNWTQAKKKYNPPLIRQLLLSWDAQKNYSIRNNLILIMLIKQVSMKWLLKIRKLLKSSYYWLVLYKEQKIKSMNYL